jgi:hypothetical protein
MLLMRHGTDPEAAERRHQVNVLAIYVANEMLQEQRQKAFDRYIAHSLPAGPSLRDRIASAAPGLRRLLGSSFDSTGTLPKLEDYPYRG